MNNNELNIPALRKYAFIGKTGDFLEKIRFLAEKLAEKENWKYDDCSTKDDSFKEYAVLYQYIMHTFNRVQEEGKIVETELYSILNTGLLTETSEEIFMLFEKNTFPNKQPWWFKGFFRAAAHEIPLELRDKLPQCANYFEGHPEDMYFDPKLQILFNIQHIVKENFERLPASLKEFDIPTISSILTSLQNNLIERIKRNNRIVVPQFYNNKICYLAPIKFNNDYIPLAIEKNDQTYRVNTILTRGMAYCNARLITKPESNWLIN